MTFLSTIKGKLISSFVTMVLLSLILGVTAFLAIESTNNQYNNLLYGGMTRVGKVYQLQTHSQVMRGYFRVIFLGQVNDASAINDFENSIMETHLAKESVADAWLENFDQDQSLTPQERNTLAQNMHSFMAAAHNYLDLGLSLLSYEREGNYAAVASGVPQLTQLGDLMDSYAELMITSGNARIDDTVAEIAASVLALRIFIVVMAIIAVALSIALSIISLNGTIKPMNHLAKEAVKIAEGDFNVQMRSNKRDEMSQLSNTISDMIEPLINLMKDLNLIKEQVVAGGLSMRVPTENYRGDYLVTVESVNEIIEILTVDTLDMLEVFKEYANGNFGASLRELEGESVVFNDVANKMQGELKSIAGDISIIIAEAQRGNLSYRLDSSRHHGDWSGLMNGLNDVLETFATPLNESAKVLGEISRGNLGITVEGNYEGEFANIKNAINNTVTSINSYIGEMSEILDAMSKKDLTIEITRDYIGDFSTIKTAINGINNNFNQIVEEIDASATQIATGVTHISDTSMGLAQGSTEQSNSIDSLNQLISTMLEQINTTADNAKITNGLADQAKDSANTGNTEMKGMLVSMEEINAASENIAKIIKVIDDIAFQTNLLALNAAVEAARAGEHGRGFAVVAEEVRALAQRSKNAAAETTALIEDSIQKTGAGSTTAQKTAQALDQIVTQINDISERISAVSRASGEQVESIGNISQSIAQISQVTQSNTATAEESASVTQELSSQTETFRSMVAEFKLKR